MFQRLMRWLAADRAPIMSRHPCLTLSRDAFPRSRRLGRFLIKAALVACGGLFLAANESAAQDPAAPPTPGSEMTTEPELPVLPETVVPGRPQAFPAEPLDEGVLVTPERGVSTAETRGSSVTVITADEIRERGQSSVLEVLRGTSGQGIVGGSAGIDVVQSGGPGRQTSVFLRGANSEHTKVLLDGIPLNNPADPTRRFDFSTLSVDNIERIEIVRGPQSVIYGSDAIGGVINIVTKRGTGPLSIRGGVQGGSFGTHEERVHASGGNEATYYSFGASYFQTEGFSAVSRRFGATENDGYRNATFSGRVGWNPSETVNVDYVFRYIDADVEVDGFDNLTFLPADQFHRQNRLNQFFNRVQLQSFAWDGIVENKVGFSVTDFKTVDTDPGFFGTPEFNGQARQIDWQSNVQITDTNVFTTGIDYLAEDASPFPAKERQNLGSLYLQDRFDLWDFSHTSIGVRWDDHSVAGPAETYRFTQAFDVQPTGGRLHGSLGRGFRAPAISQRFGGVGNPNLRPEFSKGWDVGYEQPFWDGALVFDATYFRNDFDDLIIFVSGPFGPLGFGELRNVQAARTSGVELLANTQVSERLILSASYTYLDTIDFTTNTELVRRPRNKAGFNARYEYSDRGVVNLYLIYVGNRPDFDAFGGIVRLEDYVVVNVAGNYRINDRWEAVARIDNLTDTDYEEVFAFATAGISGYAGLNFTW